MMGGMLPGKLDESYLNQPLGCTHTLAKAALTRPSVEKKPQVSDPMRFWKLSRRGAREMAYLLFGSLGDAKTMVIRSQLLSVSAPSLSRHVWLTSTGVPPTDDAG